MTNDTQPAARPHWAGDYPTYAQIVDSWGYTVLEFETFGSYQGDHLALLQNGGAVGLIVFGYGSCSGCDELESISPWFDEDDADWQPVIDFAERLRGDVHWEGDGDQLRDWIDASPENHWWAYDEEIAEWLNKTLGTTLRSN